MPFPECTLQSAKCVERRPLPFRTQSSVPCSFLRLACDLKFASRSKLCASHVALQACGRERDCVELYRYMENNHPLPKVKKQAAQLRYIIEAPKLTLSREEYVTVPLIQSDSWVQKKRKSRVPQTRPKEPTEEELKKKKKRAYWDRDWSMPGLEYIPDKWYVRVAWATTFIVFTVYANSKLM
ncbi:hypothetical protein DUNSADRAFT_6154 [Dunaliella salina]|uniref:Uncharacterized protein n=1 Tax=Dunaliella salina TaxID=3046 RepID=A0ABQ7FTX8_DUNSA|nr:hypothetical protein DUNSADRAFT_6154 [Dunaliella salina]|eukprot:KAF5825890.1 hypothetical protein DUNSADRAFT_6154 [Dunaliella salina]